MVAKTHFKEYGKLLVAGFSFSTLAVFSEIATRLSIDGFNQIVWRSLFALIISGIVAFVFLKEKLAITRRDFRYLFINGCILTGGIATFTLGIYLGSPIAKAVTLNYAYPLVVIIASYMFFKEKPSVRGWIATIISLISVSCILEVWRIHNLFSLNIGDLLELLNSFFYGLIIVYGKKLGKETKLGHFKSLCYSYIVAVPLLFGLGVFVSQALHITAIGTTIIVLSSLQNATLIGLATFGMILPLVLMYSAVAKVKTYIAGILLLTEPLWTYLFGVLLFQQTLDIWGLVGMAGIVVSVCLI